MIDDLLIKAAMDAVRVGLSREGFGKVEMCCYYDPDTNGRLIEGRVECPCGDIEGFYVRVREVVDPFRIADEITEAFVVHIKQDVRDGKLSPDWENKKPRGLPGAEVKAGK